MKIILTEAQYRLLLKESEAEIPSVTKVLGNSINKFIEIFGGNAAVKLQELIADIFEKEENYREDENRNIYLISKSNTEIPFEKFKKDIQDVVNGKSVFDLQNRFPNTLKGNTNVREKLITILSSPKESSEQPLQDFEYPLNDIGKVYKDLIESSDKWLQVTLPNEGEYSGWKLHVYTTTPDEVAYVHQQVYPIVKNAKAGLKLASIGNLNRMKGTGQQGKGISIYFPYSMIRNNQHGSFVRDINNAISKLKTKGTVAGDKNITSNISYRYEFGTTSLPVLLKGNYQNGLTYGNYKANYVESDESNFNPAPDNPDIFGDESDYYYQAFQSQMKRY